ncbi:hypothetical protein LCGC14_0484960 [marine sediment metagenome]|uniref:Uncharacterized protein n=1 Tax=marine sediment metagenome TaxID=412755 RepID=A0A0F9VH21_9ZZZZ
MVDADNLLGTLVAGAVVIGTAKVIEGQVERLERKRKVRRKVDSDFLGLEMRGLF